MEDIGNRGLRAGDRLPPSSQLAERFGVHQHTVLKAIAHLQIEGRLRVEQGRGTFITAPPVPFKLGSRTWFEENLSEVRLRPARRILSIADEPASAEVAEMINLLEGQMAKRISLLGSASDVPIYVGRIYIDTRQARLLAAFEEHAQSDADRVSVSDILSQAGFPKFRRGKIRIRSRLPTPVEASLLGMIHSQPVTETLSTLCSAAGEPFASSYATYCAQRVELTIDPDE